MEKTANLANLLHNYIRCWNINGARTLIENVSTAMRKEITRAIPDYRLESAFVIAIEEGNDDWLEFLANECGGDFDEKVCVRDPGLLSRFDNRIGDKWMSPLEISIRRNRTDMVECLVSIGADVDHVAKNGTILLIACDSRSIKTVQMLLDHGADVNTSDEDGNTCLMNVHSEVELCRLLIDKGADLNRKNNRGSTALHFAASANGLETVKLLLERGADAFSKNNDGYNALELACLRGTETMMMSMIETGSMDVKQQIEAYKLFGVSYGAGIYRDAAQDVTKAVSAWRKAIQLTSESGIVLCAATLDTPFGIVIEAMTIAELENLGENRIQISMQCMVLTSKIFGTTHGLFFDTVNSCLWRCFESGSYDRCLQLLIYIFRMAQRCNFDRRHLEARKMCSSTGIFFNRFISMFSKPKLNFQLIRDFMKTVVEESAECTQLGLAVTYITLILNAILIFHCSEVDNDQLFEFRKLVYSAVKLRLKSSNKSTIVMLAVLRFRSYAPVEKNLLHLAVVETLLECGADVRERDADGNTLVHLLMFAPVKTLQNQLKKLALAFVNNGIHLDASSDSGVTVRSCLLDLGLDLKPPINLMCLAARVIRRSNIPVEEILSKDLLAFVKMH